MNRFLFFGQVGPARIWRGGFGQDACINAKRRICYNIPPGKSLPLLMSLCSACAIGRSCAYECSPFLLTVQGYSRSGGMEVWVRSIRFSPVA